MPVKNKLRIGAGLIPIARSQYDNQTVGRDKDDPDGLNRNRL